LIRNGFRPLPEVRSISTSMIEMKPFGKGDLAYSFLNTQTKTYDMRTLILVVCSFITLSSFAQFSITDGAPKEKPVFPVLKEYSTGHTTILPTWTPGKQFLKENPSFLIDGSYKLSASMIRRKEPGRMDDFSLYSTRFIGINSSTFPANVEQSDKKLDFVKAVHFTFTMNEEANILLPLSKKWRMVDELSEEIYGIQHLVRGYNEQFTNAARSIVAQKSISTYEVSPIPSPLYGEKEMSVNNLVLDFQCLGAWAYMKKDPVSSYFAWNFIPLGASFIPITPNFWAAWMLKHKGSDYYPSNVLFQLNVRDVTGNLIKSYRQVIFVGLKGKINAAPNLQNRQLILHSMPIAMESLVNRFLNDEPALTLTRNYMQSLAKKMESNPNVLELAKAQALINMYQRRKNSFRGHIEENRINITNMGNFSQEIPQLLARQQQLNNAIYTDPTQQMMGNLGTNLSGAIGSIIVNSNIRKNAREAAIIEELFKATVENESRYVADIANLIQSDEGLVAMVGKSKTINQFFQDEMKRVVQSTAESKQKTQALTEVVKQSFSKTMTDFAARNNIDLAQMSAMAAGENPPPSSTGTGPNTAKNSKTSTDACARQYEAAWRNSAEYKKFKATGNQEDAYRSQWRQGMLILQYCGSVLPEADKAAIRKSAEQCLQNAQTLRKNNTGGIRF